LLAMLRELRAANPGSTPFEPDVQSCEGWIFGQPLASSPVG
jgi:hypothetical protein